MMRRTAKNPAAGTTGFSGRKPDSLRLFADADLLDDEVAVVIVGLDFLMKQ
jgi:hypothetical protein